MEAEHVCNASFRWSGSIMSVEAGSTFDKPHQWIMQPTGITRPDKRHLSAQASKTVFRRMIGRSVLRSHFYDQSQGHGRQNAHVYLRDTSSAA
jgi:hypothetical protein